MMHTAAVPFLITRSHDVVSGPEVTSTVERSHGLLHLDGARLTAQWSTSREVTKVGREIRTDSDRGVLHEVHIPLAGLDGAVVRWAFPWRWQLVLRASDLRSFDEFAGRTGLRLLHPAEAVLGLRWRDRAVAREFVSELNLALADVALKAAEDTQLPPSVS